MAKLSRTIFITYLVLTLFGLLFITNSSIVDAYREFGNQWLYVSRQIVWLIISIIAYFSVSKIPPQKIFDYSIVFYRVVLFFLVLVLFAQFSDRISGARRWINLGFFSFQPSEFIKGCLVVYLPYLYLTKKVTFDRFLVAGVIPMALVLLQPDLGTTLVIGSLVVGIYLLTSYKISHLLKYLPVSLLILSVYIFVSPYRLERIKTFAYSGHDPQGSSYQTRQSLIAIGSGGVLGIGIGQSRQKYNFLPESSTDSIFSIISEETGLLGGTILFILFIILISSIFRIAQLLKHELYSLTVSSVGVLISAQTLLNLAAITGLLPLTGIPLPFISYGGSSLLNLSLCLAVVTSLAKNGK